MKERCEIFNLLYWDLPEGKLLRGNNENLTK
jgi:hypothetical protein